MKCDNCPVPTDRTCTAEQCPRYEVAFCRGFALGNEAERRAIVLRSARPCEQEPRRSTPGETEGPGLLQKAVNFGNALVGHVAAGLPTVDDATAEARLVTCRGCDWFDTAHVSCRHQGCGCVLEIKTRWADQKCPIGKW